MHKYLLITVLKISHCLIYWLFEKSNNIVFILLLYLLQTELQSEKWLSVGGVLRRRCRHILFLHSEKFKMNRNGISILIENKSNLLLVWNEYLHQILFENGKPLAATSEWNFHFQMKYPYWECMEVFHKLMMLAVTWC